MKEAVLEYEVEGKTYKGFLVYDPSKGKRPAVLVAHAWKGQDDFARTKARDLAALGYVGFAADMYGDGVTATNDEDAKKLVQPVFTDRALLRQRIVAGFQALEKNEWVDKTKIGAIGFCFGGLTVIELIKSGVNLKGAVSFHGVLGSTLGTMKAKLNPPSENLKGSLLVLHGNDDPFVTEADIVNSKKEWSTSGLDWEMDIYSGTQHAFTNPQAKDVAGGMIYNPRSAARSWTRMCNFFQELGFN